MRNDKLIFKLLQGPNWDHDKEKKNQNFLIFVPNSSESDSSDSDSSEPDSSLGSDVGICVGVCVGVLVGVDTTGVVRLKAG